MLGNRFGRPGLIGLAARTAVVAGTAGAVNNAMLRRQQASTEAAAYQAEQQQAAIDAAAAQAVAAQQVASPAQGVRGDAVLDQLERLAALQQAGLLTAEELAEQKARILASC